MLVPADVIWAGWRNSKMYLCNFCVSVKFLDLWWFDFREMLSEDYRCVCLYIVAPVIATDLSH